MSDDCEHLPLDKHPEKPYEFGINYGARRVRVFMCKTDYDYEIGAASGGNRIYPSIDDLRRERNCIDQCGIVEVEITLFRVVQWDDFRSERAQGIVTEGGDASTAAPGASDGERVEPGPKDAP